MLRDAEHSSVLYWLLARYTRRRRPWLSFSVFKLISRNKSAFILTRVFVFTSDQSVQSKQQLSRWLRRQQRPKGSSGGWQENWLLGVGSHLINETHSEKIWSHILLSSHSSFRHWRLLFGGPLRHQRYRATFKSQVRAEKPHGPSGRSVKWLMRTCVTLGQRDSSERHISLKEKQTCGSRYILDSVGLLLNGKSCLLSTSSQTLERSVKDKMWSKWWYQSVHVVLCLFIRVGMSRENRRSLLQTH